MEKNKEAKNMISEVVDGKDASNLVEVTVEKGSRETTRISPESAAKARPIVEKHFKALGEELEKNDIKFEARVNDGYASIDIP